MFQLGHHSSQIHVRCTKRNQYVEQEIGGFALCARRDTIFNGKDKFR